MTGGQGAMGSAGRPAACSPAGVRTRAAASAPAAATLAGSGHDHGSYGDLAPPPAAASADTSSPSRRCASPGAPRSGRTGRQRGFRAPAPREEPRPAPDAGTAGYFTGGGGGGTAHGGTAQGTPGSHHAGVSRSFFGGTAGGDVTPASGRRVFGANRENQPRTSDGTAGGGATNTGGSLRSGAGGKSTALDSGHVGTPWGDKGLAGAAPVEG